MPKARQRENSSIWYTKLPPQSRYKRTLRRTPRSQHTSDGWKRNASGLRVKVREPISSHNARDAETRGIERGLERGRRVGVLHVGAVNRRIDERDDAPQLCGRGQGRVVADGGDVLRRGVEVLLGRNELLGGGDDLGVVAEGGDDLVGESELGFWWSVVFLHIVLPPFLGHFCLFMLPSSCTWTMANLVARIGTSKEHARGLAGQSAGIAGVAKVRERLHGVLDGTLLAETGLGEDDEGGEDDSLGLHLQQKKWNGTGQAVDIKVINSKI